MIKNVKYVELNIFSIFVELSITTVFLKKTNFENDLTEDKRLSCNKSYQRKFKRMILIHTNFLVTTIITLLHC